MEVSNRKNIARICCLILAYVFPLSVQAQAVVSLSPPSGTYEVGELFSLSVTVNTAGKPINAAFGQLNFDNSRLEAVRIEYGDSIFGLWTTQPSASNAVGTITFSGGIPNPGFNGKSGTIIRTTFRPKKVGQAPVAFVSGSVLANDGTGTDVADSFRGGLYTIVGGATLQNEMLSSGKGSVGVSKLSEAPTIIKWPHRMQNRDTLVVEGLGLPLSKIIVAIQKGKAVEIRTEVFSGPDGRFSAVFAEPVRSGYYRVWARNVNAEGMMSLPSEVVMLKVTEPPFFHIVSVAVNYATLITTLLGLVLLGLLMFAFISSKMQMWQKLRGKEMTETERTLYRALDSLKDGLTSFLAHLTGRRGIRTIQQREMEKIKVMQNELKNLEEEIGKELHDAPNP